MSRARRRATEPAGPPVHVACRRTGRPLAPAGHLACPYCFGDAGTVASADHERFCDFQPGKDPLAFGFPQDAGRYRSR